MIEFPRALETAFERLRNQHHLRFVEGQGHLMERSIVWNEGSHRKHLIFDPYEGVSVHFREVTPLARFVITKLPHVSWKGSWPTVVFTDVNERLAVEILPINETADFYAKKIEGYLTRFGKKL